MCVGNAPSSICCLTSLILFIPSYRFIHKRVMCSFQVDEPSTSNSVNGSCLFYDASRALTKHLKWSIESNIESILTRLFIKLKTKESSSRCLMLWGHPPSVSWWNLCWPQPPINSYFFSPAWNTHTHSKAMLILICSEWLCYISRWWGISPRQIRGHVRSIYRQTLRFRI